MLGVRKFGSLFLILKLGKFPLLHNFFFDLAIFQDLDNFLPFEFLKLDNFSSFDNFPVFDNFSYFLIISSPPLILPILLVASI